MAIPTYPIRKLSVEGTMILDASVPERVGRLRAVALFAACVAVLGLAISVVPDARGLGTHQQLGLPPCSLVVMTGLPCPTCGMTTAFAHAARAQFAAAWLAQPAGLALALGVMAVGVGSLYSAVSGRSVRWRGPRWSAARIGLAAVLLLFGGWGFKLLSGLWSGTLPAR